MQAGSAAAQERLLRRAGAPLDLDEKRALLEGDQADDKVASSGELIEVRTAAPDTSTEEPALLPEVGATNAVDGIAHRTPLFSIDELLVDGQPVPLLGPGAPAPSNGQTERTNGLGRLPNHKSNGYGGHTDLDTLDRLGMAIALAYECNRMRKAGEPAEVLDLDGGSDQPHALIFDTSTPACVERAMALSPRFHDAMLRLHSEFGISPEWPGFDILSLSPSSTELPDRLIELKSSGVEARTQEMSWNEWKVAGGPLRPHFFLYVVGNLRSDLKGATPFVRTVQDPFGQLAAEVSVARTTQRKVQLAVYSFREAEQLLLTVARNASHSQDPQPA
jgi:hypothetical protein